MTEMLLEWLNSEVKLSKKVTDIIEDFSSGYLIAEILHKYEQIPNIHDYKNKSDTESKTNNFRLLEKALRDLEIKVLPKSMKEIYDKRKGAAAKFLYQIKMTLSKKGINFERLLMRNSNQLHSVYTAMKYPTQNDKYRADASKKMVSPLDEKTLTMKKVGIDPTKIMTDRHEQFRLTSDIKVIEERIKEEECLKEEHDKNVSKIHQKEKETHINLVKEDQKAEESWNKNISNMKEWEKNQRKEEMKDVDYFRTKILDAFIKSSKETEIQIDAFDKNLSRLGLDVAIIDTKFKKNPNAQISSEMVMQKIKEKVEKETAAKKEKDRRNRLINLEPNKIINSESNKNIDPLAQSNLNPLDSLSSAHQKRLEYEKLRELHDRNEKREMKIIQNKQNNSVFENEFGSNSEVVFNPEAFLSSLRKENLKFRISELANKKKKKKRDFKLLTSVFNQILEITDSVYDFQQKNNTELIDLSEWRNLMQKFIGGKETDGKEDYFEKEASDSKTQLRQNSPIKKLAKNASDLDSVMLGITPEFEENEFLDYLNLKGQWKDSIVPREALNIVLKITDVVGPEFFDKGNNKPKDVYNYKEVEYEPNDDEIENLTIPEDNCKNYHLGEIIDIVTDLKFPEKQGEVNNKILFSQVPIKLSLIGHSFSGKKTAAEGLAASNPNLKVYNIEELIKRTIDNLDKLEQPLEANPKFKTLKKNQIEQLQNERAAEEEKFKEFKKLILPIRDAIRAGETPEDESLVDLLLHYIKLDFPERDSNIIHEEILKKAKRKKEITEELAKIKEEQAKKPKAKAKEESLLLAELAKMTAEANKGFIIVDFPRNVNQAMILESKLSGYIQDIDKPSTQLQEDRNNFAKILDKSLKPASGKIVRQGGLQIMVQLNVNSKECLRRAAGRRQDPTTGNIYHLEDNPPPSNDHKLNDRLIKLEEPTETKLLSQHEYFDLALPTIKVFYDAFGFNKSDIKFFNCIEGTSKETVLHELVEFISKLQKLNEEKEVEIVSKEKALHNSENQSNANNNSFFVEHKELQSRETVDRNVDLFNVQSTEGEDEFVRYCKKLEESKKKLNMNIVESIYLTWSKLFEIYSSESKQVFKFFKKQREKLVTNFTRLQGKFIEFLKRPSKKIEEANKYIAKYNKFADDYPELLDDLQVKEEFHQDVVDLSDRIWEVIDIRKNEAIEELRKIMTSGWIEREMGKFYTHLESLFILEADKLIQVLTILRIYYNGMDNKISPINSNILNAMKSNDILTDTSNINLESEDNSASFPRIERLHKNCIKLIFKFDEIVKHFEALLKTTTPNHSPDSRKKMTKSFTYRKMQVDSTFLDDKRDIFIFDEELKHSVKNEKNKFKYRVTLLKHWGIDKLKTMRRLATNVFDNMDEWIINSVKAENEAMNSLTDYLKGSIEREMKAKITVELDRFDVYKVVDVPSFFDKVLPLPFKAIMDNAMFNLEKFRSIIEEIKTYELQKYYVRTTTFIDIYFKKYCDSQGVPDSIKSLSFHNYTKFINFFETKSGQYSSGFVNIKHLSTILTLLHCKVLDEPGENYIRSAAEPHLFNTGMITKDSFMQIEFPFEKDPSSVLRTQDELYENDNDRIIALKEILYAINRDDCGNIALFDFMEILNLKFLNSGLADEERNHKTYYEILLFN